MWQRIFFSFVSVALLASFAAPVFAADADGDGFSDEIEIAHGYSPIDPRPAKPPKRIEIDLGARKLSYFVGGYKIGEHAVSPGTKDRPTPKGEFKILNKHPKAWSRISGLWMPYWMGFAAGGKVGLHELPIWPSGKREGADHLGKPASHGCVRLGIGPAKALYDWADVGTKVLVK